MLLGLWHLASRAAAKRRILAPVLLLLAIGPALAHHIPLSSLLVPVLEERFAQTLPADGTKIEGIIALGGDQNRVVEAVALAHRFPDAKLVIAGADEKAQAYARANGISANRLVLETRSRNTYQNAVFTQAMLTPRVDDLWLLVTSASHMPRAIGCFRKAGFRVMPWPVTPASEASRYSMRIAKHEWLGLIAYWALGRTDSLFPAPHAD